MIERVFLLTRTTNLNLPQWVAADPVQREDFNEAFAALDEAYSGIAREEEVDAQADYSLNRAGALALNLYQLASRHRDPGLWQAMACNLLTSAAELAGTTAVPMAGGGVCVGEATGLTLDRLNGGITAWTDAEITTIGGSGTAKVEFTSQVAGTLTALGIWIRRTTVTSSITLPLYVRLYDRDSGSQLYDSGQLTSAVLASPEITQTLTVAVPVEIGRNYRLELYTSGGTYSGSLGFGVPDIQAFTGSAAAQPRTAGQAAVTLPLSGVARRALAIARYTGQAPDVTLGGVAMTPGNPADTASVSGNACQERVYTLDGSFSGALTATAALTGSSSETTRLFDLGIVAV